MIVRPIVRTLGAAVVALFALAHGSQAQQRPPQPQAEQPKQASPAAIALAKSTPDGVSTTPRLVRSNSITPSCSSSPETCRLIAPCVSESSSAASEKLPSRATQSKAASADVEGRSFRERFVIAYY